MPINFSKLFQLFQRFLQPTKAKEPKPAMTLTMQIKIVNNRIKTTSYFHVYLPQTYVLQKVHSLLSFSSSLPLLVKWPG